MHGYLSVTHHPSRARLGLLGSILAAATITPTVGQEVCDYRGGTGAGGQGVIVEFISREQAKSLISQTQAKVHATISPQYISNRRVLVGMANGRRAVVLLPDRMVAKPGDRVAFAPAHRDPSWPCSYVPALVIGFVRGAGPNPP